MRSTSRLKSCRTAHRPRAEQQGLIALHVCRATTATGAMYATHGFRLLPDRSMPRIKSESDWAHHGEAGHAGPNSSSHIRHTLQQDLLPTDPLASLGKGVPASPHTRVHGCCAPGRRPPLALNTMAMSKFLRLKPTRSRFMISMSLSDITVKGICVSSTRQFTVGSTCTVSRWGTPSKPSSLQGSRVGGGAGQHRQGQP